MPWLIDCAICYCSMVCGRGALISNDIILNAPLRYLFDK